MDLSRPIPAAERTSRLVRKSAALKCLPQNLSFLPSKMCRTEKCYLNGTSPKQRAHGEEHLCTHRRDTSKALNAIRFYTFNTVGGKTKRRGVIKGTRISFWIT